MNEALIEASRQAVNPKVKAALLRLAEDVQVARVWSKLPENAANKLSAACIFYWESQNLPSKGEYAKEIDLIGKAVVDLQARIKKTFGVYDDELNIKLSEYRVDVLASSKEAYKAFYMLPRPLLMERLYVITGNQPKPNHEMVATLASAITGETISAIDIQSTYRNLKSAKMPLKK
jgi:hypothetical protein